MYSHKDTTKKRDEKEFFLCKHAPTRYSVALRGGGTIHPPASDLSFIGVILCTSNQKVDSHDILSGAGSLSKDV